MLEYSRDAMAAPMRDLGEVLRAVTEGSFRPDMTRSGYFVGGKPAKPVPPAPTESEAVADLPRRPVRACFDTVKDRLGDHPWPSPYVYIGRGNRTARIPKSAWCNQTTVAGGNSQNGSRRHSVT